MKKLVYLLIITATFLMVSCSNAVDSNASHSKEVVSFFYIPPLEERFDPSDWHFPFKGESRVSSVINNEITFKNGGCAVGQEVLAPFDGIVRSTYDNQLIVFSQESYLTYFISGINLEVVWDQHIKKGQKVGTVLFAGPNTQIKFKVYDEGGTSWNPINLVGIDDWNGNIGLVFSQNGSNESVIHFPFRGQSEVTNINNNEVTFSGGGCFFGRPVLASFDGVVRKASYGEIIIYCSEIKKTYVIYGVNNISINWGDNVQQGQQIASVQYNYLLFKVYDETVLPWNPMSLKGVDGWDGERGIVRSYFQ